MIATIHSNDRTGLVAAALVAGGLAAAGLRPTVVALAGDGAQACGLARLSGNFEVLRPEPRDVMSVISHVASRSKGDVVALLPMEVIHVADTAVPGKVRVVATACGLTAAQALHAAAAGTWHLRCDGGYGQPAWRMAPRVLPLRLPRFTPLDRMRLVSGEIEDEMRYMAVALAATLLAVSVDPCAEHFEAIDLAALLSAEISGEDDQVRKRLLRCAAALNEPGVPATVGMAQATGRAPRETRSVPPFARRRAAHPGRLQA